MADILTQAYFGNTLFQYLLFFIAVAVFALAGKAVSYIVKTYCRRITAKSRFKLDDLLLDLVEQPIVFAMIILGLVIGFNFLSFGAGARELFYSIINILVILLTGWVSLKAVDVLVEQYFVPLITKADKRLAKQIAPLIEKIIKVGIVFLVFIVILNYFGYNVTAILAGLGIGGLAFAFAAQATIADAFGGFSIFTSRPFVVGDWVSFDNILGTVEQVGLRHTRIRNLEGRVVIIPNSKIAGTVIENISSAPKRKILLNLGLTYDTPVEKIQKAIGLVKELINKRKDCSKEPLALFTEFKDFSLNLMVVYFIEDLDNWLKIKHEVNMEIKRQFDENGIEFAFPTQTVHLKKD